MQTADRYSNADVADNLALAKRDILKVSEQLARLQRLYADELYPTGAASLEATVMNLNHLAIGMDERIEILNAREAR